MRYLEGGVGDESRLRTTPDGGLAVLMINASGAPTVKGTLVCPSPAVDIAFIATTEEFDTIGVMYESGIPDGSPAWVVISGLADVLIKDGTAINRRNLMIASATDGRAEAIAAPPPPPNADTHFKEIGHAVQSVSAGTNVLCRCILHFN